jgi:integrase
MASAKKTAEGTWRIQVMVGGRRVGETLPTKREAVEWAARKTLELQAVKLGLVGTTKSLRDAMRKYAAEVSTTKRGEAKEVVRLRAFERQALPLDQKLSDLTTAQLVAWRDARLAVNARGSVLRDMTMLGAVLETARREWQWVPSNPMKDVRRPQEPDHRERLIRFGEIRVMLRALKYGREIRAVSNAVAHCFVLALSTGMRAGELAGLTWAQVRTDHVRLLTTKSGKPREVPLSPVGRRIVERMRGWDETLVFGITSQTLDGMFRKYRDRSGLKGFCFHDARHTAATRLARSRRVDVLELCKILGWRDPKQAMTYFNPSVSQLAARL